MEGVDNKRNRLDKWKPDGEHTPAQTLSVCQCVNLLCLCFMSILSLCDLNLCGNIEQVACLPTTDKQVVTAV